MYRKIEVKIVEIFAGNIETDRLEILCPVCRRKLFYDVGIFTDCDSINCDYCTERITIAELQQSL